MQKPILQLCIFLLFGTQGFSQVNVQTGSAEVNLPIFNFADSKSGLSHNVSIAYSSGDGFRVSESPSAIGQGWNLIAGGYIIRKQNGEPDDQNSTVAFPPVTYVSDRVFNQAIAVYTDNYQSSQMQYVGDCYSRQYVDHYYPNGYLYSEFPLDISDNYPLHYAAPLDLAFIPRFRGSQDKRWKQSKRSLADREQDVFMFNFNGRTGEFVIGKNGQIVTTFNSKLKIEKVEADMTASKIRTRISEFKITDEAGIIYKFSALNLSEILEPREASSSEDGGFTVSISEEDAIGEYVVSEWQLTSIKNPFTNEEITFTYLDKDIDYLGQWFANYNQMEHDNYQNVDILKSRIKGKEKKLQSITFPNGHSVEINYDNVLRQDLANEKRISSISIKYNNSLVNQFNLTQAYFFKTEIRPFTETFVASDKRYLRLTLTGIQNIGADGVSEPPYQFTYNSGMVPPRDCLGVDYWGHFTGYFYDGTVPSRADLKYLLKDGVYRDNPSVAKNGLLKAVKNPAGGEISYNYLENWALGNNPVNNPPVGGVHVNYIKQYDGIDHNNDLTKSYSYVLEDGTSSLWGYEAPQNGLRRELKYYNNPTGYNYSGNSKSNIINPSTFSKILTYYKIAKKIYNTIFLSVPPNYIIQYVIGKTVEAILLFTNLYDYEHTNSYDFYPMNYNNPIGLHFSRVVITNSLPGTMNNGKIVQEFSKPANISTEILSNDFPYSARPRFGAWKYDQLKKEKVYDNADFLISEKEYNYYTSADEMTDVNFLSSKVQPNYFHSTHNEASASGISVSNLTAQAYHPIIGMAQLTSTNQKMYSNSGVVSENGASIEYNDDYLPKTNTIAKSNGDQVISKTYYSNDYDASASTALAQLKQKNILSVPVATEIWLKKAGTTDEYLTDASVNEFTILGNGQVKLSKVYTLESKIPLLKGTIADWSKYTLLRDANYFKLQKELLYDANGNLVQTIAKGDETVSNIYDYNNRLVTATATNASASSIAYTSFEADGSGNWTFNTAQISNTAIFGKKSFQVSLGNSISTSITINHDFILSFWENALSPLTVSGSSTLVKTGPTINGWTYKEYKINSASSSPVISGSGLIDELRLYPSNAKMSTTLYDPARGKIMECDINNRIVYYQYDGLGRLVATLDDHKNIIKTYEYHFKN